MENKITLENINSEFLNPFDASLEELMAEALDQFGLINESSKLNDVDINEHLKSFKKKKRVYKGVLPRKTSVFTKIGSLLIQKNIITNNQLKEALDYQKHTPIKVGEILVKMGFADKNAIMDTIEEQKRMRSIIQRITEREKVEVHIDYKEPLFEKTIERTEDKPYTYSQSFDTSDVAQAIINALSTYFNNEQKSNVHWQSEIVKLRVTIDLV